MLAYLRALAPLVMLLAAGCFTERPAVISASTAPPPAYHMHLPGIGGYRSIDRGMLKGLQEGGLDAQIEGYDWTVGDPGLGSLLSTKMHTEQSAIVARKITELVKSHPNAKVTISCHSAGAGIIAWALEQCADDVKVDDVLFLSPALSPKYDLSRMLRHVRGKVYVIFSPYDAAVLGIGTSMLGTIDGVKADAAGKVGFTMPNGADELEYAKVVQVKYDSHWIRLGNIGDHIGCMSRPFSRQVLAPLLLRGELVDSPAIDALMMPATALSDEEESQSESLAAPAPAR